MYLTTSDEMRLMDKIAIEDFGLPGLVLMENAARSVAQAAFDFWPHWPPKARVGLLVGPGQNGGDGWALARIFSARGLDPVIFDVSAREIGGDAAVNRRVALNLGLPVIEIRTEKEARELSFDGFTLLVDAVFGTGLNRPAAEPMATALRRLGETKRTRREELRLLAVDLPSGLSGDSGRLWGPPVPADLTVTLGAPKIGLFLKDGPTLAGRIMVGDIGLTPRIWEKKPPRGRLSDPSGMARLLPNRPLDGHKGRFGHVAAVGGSRGFSGALCLAAEGASGSGAALVTAFHPESLGDVLAVKLTEAMTRGLPEDPPGRFSTQAGPALAEGLAGKTSVVLGPGMGLNPGAAALLDWVLAHIRLPLVLDADALTLLAGRPEALRTYAGPLVLTPHPGEAGRLLGRTAGEIQDDRLGAARELAGKSQAVVLLKGHNTLIVEPEGRFHLNPSGGPHLAVGGSGDLLGGLLAGLLAQALEPFSAAVLAAWIHGRAGDLTKAEEGPFGLKAGRFASRLPQAFAELTKIPLDPERQKGHY